jgi:hypothetical protein
MNFFCFFAEIFIKLNFNYEYWRQSARDIGQEREW